MLPTMIDLLRQLGLDAKWAVMGTERKEFFILTKKIHNLIHGNRSLNSPQDAKMC